MATGDAVRHQRVLGSLGRVLPICSDQATAAIQVLEGADEGSVGALTDGRVALEVSHLPHRFVIVAPWTGVAL